MAERRELALDWLERLGLKGHAYDYPHALSGGMRQRVSLARAFAVNPDILLCDEPFSALDELTGQRLREEYTQLVRENGKTSIFVTHSIDGLAAGRTHSGVSPPGANRARGAGRRRRPHSHPPARAHSDERARGRGGGGA